MKRGFDILFSSLVLILSSPFLLVVSLLVCCKLGKPVFFKQERPGLFGKSFQMYKFRTMTNAKDLNGDLLPDECRMTKLGSFLRKTSLDEFPEFFNVLKGDMSIVGPRPLLIRYLPLYTEEQARRHHVKPGITGWAQVNGRNAISWEKKFEYDVWYVDHCSFFLDLKILFMTIWRVVKREGISELGEATMSAFTGSTKNGKNE